VQAWAGSRSITLSSNEIIQLPTRKLRDRVSLCEPLAFRFAITVQPFGRFVARRRHCALADFKSGGASRQRVLAVGVLRCPTGGVAVVAAHQARHMERRQGKGKGGAAEMKPCGREFAEGGEESV